MSEYQYYEWQTVDRILTAEEQAAVNRLSSHIDVSSSRAVVTYDWGSFKHDPREVLLKYFDAHFYLADWGSLRLMFRFPRGSIDEADIEPYCVYEYISFDTIGQYQVLELDFSPEDGGWLEPTNADLSDFISLRADLLEGDYRLLYLAWLKAATPYADPDVDESGDPDNPAFDHEPPVPAGLKKLSPALQSFVQVFEIDPFLVESAAEASPDPKKALAVEYGDLVRRLSRAECDDFLTRLAEGEAGVGLTLRKRLAAFFPPPERSQTAQPRTIQQLLQRAEQLEQAEEKRQTEAARQKHIAEMKALAAREGQTWKKVEDLLENSRRIASVYDEATALLEKLKQLSEFQDTRDIFQRRLRQLAGRYAARPALTGRWKQRGWI
jgi:hypothetical protein